MNRIEWHQQNGANLATDGIPLQYGNPSLEYNALLNGAALFDRSHEGRLLLSGNTRFELLNRMSTNHMLDIPPDHGKPTILTTPNARIIERIEAYHRDDTLLILTQPGRSTVVQDYLARNIFFNDQATIRNQTAETAQFAIHGPAADTIANTFIANASTWPIYQCGAITLGHATVWLIKRKSLLGGHWVFITEETHSLALLSEILARGQNHGIQPAGSLTYNVLRIQTGALSVNELNNDYIPLEVGLWDEVSFAKGCYTGQEIIARMDSREKLTRGLVRINLSQFVASPAPILTNGQVIGTLTSSVTAPDGQIYAIGVMKLSGIKDGTIGIGQPTVPATVNGLLGNFPQWVAIEP